MNWVVSLYPSKVKKVVFKDFFYWSRTSPVEHRRMKKQRVMK